METKFTPKERMFFCFECGETFTAAISQGWQKDAMGCKCGVDFLNALRYLSFGPDPSKGWEDEDEDIDLTSYFPPFFGLLTSDGTQTYLVREDGCEQFYSCD